MLGGDDPVFSLILSTGGERSVLVAESVGNASLSFLLRRRLAHTAEAVLVHGSIVEDKEMFGSSELLH